MNLCGAVSTLANQIRSNKFALVVVPPSKVYNPSAVRTSIEIMINWYNQGMGREAFGYSKEFYDCKYLLTRTYDIRACSHK